VTQVTIDIPAGAMRAYQFDAIYPGDWALHCRKSHHTMNAMGHDVRTFIGVNKKEFSRQMKRMVPDYMAMATAGVADMGKMEMPLPDNTLPMMTGFGMFTVVKVREGLSAGDYKDPGWYQHPPGTVAY
jgi:manganese oxidase